MRILIGHHGLRGDLAINVPTLHHIRERNGAEIDMPIHKQFSDMLPLFVNQPGFTPIITDGYDTFPTPTDQKTIGFRQYNQVCDPMQQHRLNDWYNYHHQTSTVSYDYLGETLPKDKEQISLYRWFDVDDRADYIAFAPFAGWSHEKKSDKMLTVERAQIIVFRLRSMGFKVLQVGGPDEPKLDAAELFVGSYFDSVRAVLSCRLLLHTDTGMGWIVSGYQHPQVGLYGHRYYGKDKASNIQPRNPNSLYLDDLTVNDIEIDLIGDFVALVS